MSVRWQWESSFDCCKAQQSLSHSQDFLILPSPISTKLNQSQDFAQNLKTRITSSFLLWEQSRSLPSYRDHLHILHIQITFRSHQDQQMALVFPFPTTFPHLDSHRSLTGSAPDELQTKDVFHLQSLILCIFLFQDTIFKVSHLHRSIIGRKFALDQTRSARSTETRSTRWRDTNKRGCNTSTFEEGSTRWILDQ